MSSPPSLSREANYFSKQNNEKVRSSAWSSLGYFQKKIGEVSKLNLLVKTHMGGRRQIKGLTMACGGMTGEYNFLIKSGVQSIDAFDISPGQRGKFFKRIGGI